MREIADLLGEFDVFVVRQVRTVDHDGRKAALDAALAQVEAVAMVEVKHDGNVESEFVGIFDRALGHMAQHCLVGVFPSPRGDLKNDRTLRLDAGLDNGLKLLHVVEIVGGNGITALYRLLEQLDRIAKAELLIAGHQWLLCI